MKRLGAAFLDDAVKSVAEAAERIGVARLGAAHGGTLDLHGAPLAQGLDQAGFGLGLIDEGALVLGEQLEFSAPTLTVTTPPGLKG